MLSPKAVIIGSGVAGMACAIRLAVQGFEVHVYEKNSYPGGKLSSLSLGGYHFDAGPSLFTQPENIAELFELAGEDMGEYLQYETESDLRDYENVPLKENIYEYFTREVKPHVAEAWINLEVTKVGYEISFNKYFYRHKPLRSLEEVGADILQLENDSEGLIREILNLA